MKVVTIKTNEGKERYYVANDEGIPIESVLKFIKFKDNVNYARNTLKQYCQSLKLYFEYLEFIQKDFKDITIDDLALFVNWLQKPKIQGKVVQINCVNKTRCPKTINTVIDTVLSYYDYLLRHEEYSNDISEKVKKFLCQSTRNFKGFLYGIAYDKRKISSSILKLKLPKVKPKVLNKEEVSILIATCRNYRDKFLLSILYETGMRIGEICALRWSDINLETGTISINHTIERIYIIEGGKRHTKLVMSTPKTKNSIREIPMNKNSIKSKKNRYITKYCRYVYGVYKYLSYRRS